MIPLRAMWSVSAGIIPGTEVPEYAQDFVYTNPNYAEDLQEAGLHEEDPEWESRFMAVQADAYAYAKSITHPGYVNWVRVDFMWM